MRRARRRNREAPAGSKDSGGQGRSSLMTGTTDFPGAITTVVILSSTIGYAASSFDLHS